MKNLTTTSLRSIFIFTALALMTVAIHHLGAVVFQTVSQAQGNCPDCTPLQASNLGAHWAAGSTVYVNFGNITDPNWTGQLSTSAANMTQLAFESGANVTFTVGSPPPGTPNPQVATFQFGTTSGGANREPVQITSAAVFTGTNMLAAVTITIDLTVQRPNQQGQMVQALNPATSSTIGIKVGNHELGHTLGFGEGTLNSNCSGSTCAGQVPGSSIMNGLCGANDWGNNMPSSDTSCDVDRLSQLPQYQPSPTPTPEPGQGPCFANGNLCFSGAECCSQWCHPYWSTCQTCPGQLYDGLCTETPTLIDTAGNGFDLTNLQNGVNFDHNVDSIPERSGWTSAGSDDALLAMDRNGNGNIDNGAELFGEFTPQPEPVFGKKKNGFLALAEYDKPANGGNGDGVITKHDQVFPSLLLWQDKDHNGQSALDELKSMDQSGLGSIDLNYKESKKVDQYGNRFRYRAKVKDKKGAQMGRWAWDVLFVVDPYSRLFAIGGPCNKWRMRKFY